MEEFEIIDGFKEKLKEIAEFLEGKKKELVLETVTNQYGEEIPKKTLVWKEGEVVLREIACWGSSDLGLGSCRCINHEPISETGLNNRGVIDYLKDYIERLAEKEIEKYDNKEKLKEIAEEIKRILEDFS